MEKEGGLQGFQIHFTTLENFHNHNAVVLTIRFNLRMQASNPKGSVPSKSGSVPINFHLIEFNCIVSVSESLLVINRKFKLLKVLISRVEE